MTNALFILFIVTAAWAVVGVHLFGDKSQEYFGNFEAALFSMFQVVSGDSWASGITRSIFKVRAEVGGWHADDRVPSCGYYLYR